MVTDLNKFKQDKAKKERQEAAESLGIHEELVETEDIHVMLCPECQGPLWLALLPDGRKGGVCPECNSDG